MKQERNWKNREKHSHTTHTEPYAIYHVSNIARENDIIFCHWHPEAEFFYLSDGEADFFLENDHFHMSAGDAILIPPNRLHNAVCPEHSGASSYACVFSADLIAKPEDTLHFRKYVQPFLQNINNSPLFLTPDFPGYSRLSELLENLFLSPNASDLAIRGNLFLLWDIVYTHLFAGSNQSAQTDRLENLLMPVLHFIHEHYADTFSLKILADLVPVSEAHLCRLFKDFTGSTPFAYLKKYRLMKSCELLIHSNKKISEICTLCGFNNVSYYNREFVHLLKMPPSVYRRNACHIHSHIHL